MGEIKSLALSFANVSASEIFKANKGLAEVAIANRKAFEDLSKATGGAAGGTKKFREESKDSDIVSLRFL